ncbi:hypothetical protein C1924_16410 [Stenotrophomonas sp. ESTM1D_MKCIP4_1]|uniref:hypothetical protein n=1 Tax=Stenotrophomonas sp. ESTM1D_MKCIP4_1 TaxID=2072414 RepID=UPI000D53E7B2|nr:hypothetical protein [Stenotrophomonas sp. ESTM1D_MKCIP4_1]AWH54648.1 hypothetical protein C1924_16410 [Stenotrophomonas sp. ESTM1D_MKCIP4_1]
MRLFALRFIPVLVALPLSADVHAAASLLVDDAGTTPAAECQLESWLSHHTNHRQATLVPACGLGNTEWSLGISRLSHGQGMPWALGAKRTVVGPEGDRLRVAISADAGNDARSGNAANWGVTVPLSLRLDTAGRMLLHANLGWRVERDARYLTSGIGMELPLLPRWSLLAEGARDAAGSHAVQMGGRRELGAAGATLDVLAGRRFGDAGERWLTLGLNLPLSR